MRAAFQGELEPKRVSDSTNDAGHGVAANIDGNCEVVGTILHVLVDGIYAGHIVIADTIKADAEQTIRDLHDVGVEITAILKGEREMGVKNL